MGIATKIRETKKAEQIAALSYEGVVKTVWLPKKMIKKEKKTIDGKKGEIYTLPRPFTRAHNIPDEIFLTDADTFCEILNDILPDLEPNLDEATVHFTPAVKIPDEALKLVYCGLVPLRKTTTIYFIPASHIAGFNPVKRAWKILVNTDFMKSEDTADTPYRSFVFIVNGEVWQWKEGSVYPPESFITNEDEPLMVVE